MTVGGKGKGRGRKTVGENVNDGREARAAAAAKPTHRPRPDWMNDRSKLPKHPPGKGPTHE